MILQIEVPDLVRTIQAGSGVDDEFLLPVWQNPGRSNDKWLCMAEIGPVLGIDPRSIRSSEWLACGHVLRSRFSAAWPIIEGKLFFEQGNGEDIIDLFTYVCGREPDYVRQDIVASRYTYDWDTRVFLDTTEWNRQESSAQVGGGFASANVGLGYAASHSTRSVLTGHIGFLRGMIVMD